MTKKFLSVCESALTRFARGGFLTGDVVRFVDKFKSHEPYKALGSNVQAMIDEIIAAGLNIRVVGINDADPQRYPGNPDTMTGNVVVNIALDNGGGRYTHYCTIPSCCIEPVEHYPNLAPMPDGVVRPNGTIIKPEEFEFNTDNKEAEDQTMKADQGGVKKSVMVGLPTKNIKMKAVTVKGATSPAVDAYTIKYMQGQ
jgi:hypothetical protein